MGYLIYGKTFNSDFLPLNWEGEQQVELEKAFEYATREDALERLVQVKPKDGTYFDIRRAK